MSEDKGGFRRTNIVCTLGPASDAPGVLENMILAGMNIARLNFSHGTHEEHARRIKRIRAAAEQLGRPVSILQDLAGPKIRLGDLPGEGVVTLDAHEKVLLTSGKMTEKKTKVLPVAYEGFDEAVKLGDQILLSDGALELKVLEKTSDGILCEVMTRGVVSSRKGINLPSKKICISCVTEKDIEDLKFGIEQGVDMAALSFVMRASDIEPVKRQIEASGRRIPTVAKIEKPAAVENLKEIIEATDGVMAARGDLGVETPLEGVPRLQKKIIREANDQAKPVILATQMLKSMVDNPRPTRAEAADVANGVLDGADALMLSEESAVGRFPAQAVAIMDRIIRDIEKTFPHKAFLERDVPNADDPVKALTLSACRLAETLNVKAIIVPTESGSTALQVASRRPRQPIIALSPNQSTVSFLQLVWGVKAYLVPRPRNADDVIRKSMEAAKKFEYLKSGEKVIFVAGLPIEQPGLTNLIKVAESP